MGCADPPSTLRRGSVHTISVFELTKNEVIGESYDVTGLAASVVQTCVRADQAPSLSPHLLLAFPGSCPSTICLNFPLQEP